MKEKVRNLTDQQLIDVAKELMQITVAEDALIRTLLNPNKQFALQIIDISGHLVQEMAKRLQTYNSFISED